jgi:hypothetical protein
MMAKAFAYSNTLAYNGILHTVVKGGADSNQLARRSSLDDSDAAWVVCLP